MSDFTCYIPHVYNEELLAKAIESVAVYGEDRIIIDNSPYQDDLRLWPEVCAGMKTLARWHDVGVYRPTVPLSCSQTFNHIMRTTLQQGKKFCIWMHSDAEAVNGAAQDLLNFMRETNANHPSWGVIFTFYDTMCVLNAELLNSVGEWDTILPQYATDNDYYRRLRLAGYECVESHLPVKHVGSQTINSHPDRQFLNSITFPMYIHYYAQKWGGEPGHETFLTPFNR